MAQGVVFISVTGNKFPVTRNILTFKGKNPPVTDFILLLSQEFFFLSQGVFLSSHLRGNVLPMKRSTVCVTLEYFMSQEEFFIFHCHKKKFSCETK